MKKVFCIQTSNVGVSKKNSHVPPCLKGHHYTVIQERDISPQKAKEFDCIPGIWYATIEMGPKYWYYSGCFIDVEDDTPDMDEILSPKEESTIL